MRQSSMTRAITLVAAVALSTASTLSLVASRSASAASELTAFYVDGWGLQAHSKAVYVVEAEASPWVAYYDSSSGDSGNGLVSVHVNTLNDPVRSFHLDFAAPPGEQLAVGHYPNAVAFPINGPGQPGIDIGKAGTGCQVESGEFTIYHLKQFMKALASSPDVAKIHIVR